VKARRKGGGEVMNCREVADLLPLFLDEELAPDEMKEVSNHLSVCSSCRQLLAEFKREQQILRSLPPVAPPPTWRAELLKRVKNQRRPSAIRFFVPRLGSLAAALLVVLLMTNLYVFPSYVLNRHHGAPPEYRIAVSENPEVANDPSEPDGAQTNPETTEKLQFFDLNQKADDLVRLTATSDNSLQRRWWLWSSSLCLVMWLTGAGYYYYQYRRLQEQID